MRDPSKRYAAIYAATGLPEISGIYDPPNPFGDKRDWWVFLERMKRVPVSKQTIRLIARAEEMIRREPYPYDTQRENYG